jgi:3-phosphoshikimate 1-carboxyvinyltransferase
MKNMKNIKSIKIRGLKKPLQGTLTVLCDKSITHRAVILGSLASGVTKIANYLEGEDCLNTIKIFQQMGVNIKKTASQIVIKGVGLDGLQKPNTALNVGNSGTSFRLLLGVLAAQDFITKLNGDSSIQKRPMDRVVGPLRQMGAKFSGDKAPIIVFPSSKKIKGISYKLPVASAQVKSAILLAGLYANNKTTVIETVPSRDHTERMLKVFGSKITQKNLMISLPAGEKKLKGTTIKVPGDISAAAFFIAAALIIPKSKLTIKNVGVNPTRTGFISALQQMGGNIVLKNKKVINGEPVADIVVQYSTLQGKEFSGDIIVSMIDEIPILAVVASFATGKTIISNAEELRVKESDRIATITDMLTKFGVKVTEKKDGMIIEGLEQRVLNKKVVISSHHDHRIAMASIIFGLANQKETAVNDITCIATSFPGFTELLKKAIK